MTGFLFLIGLGFLIAGLVKFFSEDAKENAQHDQVHTFQASLQRGEMQTRVRFSYRDGDTEFLLDAERTIREWGAGYELSREGPPSPADYKLLDSILGEALAEYRPKVISIAVFGLPEPPPETPPTPTPAECLDAEIVSNVNCVETAMNRLHWVQKEKPEVASLFLKGRTVERLVKDVVEEESDGLEEMVKRKLNGMFHDPNRVR